MSLNSLVRRQARNAFKLIGDLKVKFIFSRESKTFDKVTLENKITSTVSESVEGVLLESRNTKGYDTKLMLLAENAPDIQLYDTAIGNGVRYKIVPPISNDGYLITVRMMEVT